jgi:hypothetical protein
MKHKGLQRKKIIPKEAYKLALLKLPQTLESTPAEVIFNIFLAFEN